MRALFILTSLLALLLQVKLSLQQGCSATNACPLGCCSKSGYCGYGPDYCGDGCQGTCDRKSECNPGWDGDQWSNATGCPLKVCCGKSGYCGTTQDFCGDQTVERPSCDAVSTGINRVIGYYEAWSMTERSCYGMQPDDIPFGIYTHINFAFATIDPHTFQIQPGSADTESMMNRIGSLKLLQPDLQIWISVVGWSFNDPWMPTATTFSDIAGSEENQDSFINSLILMMNKYDFDGVDIDWEYPVADDRSGRTEDYENYTKFIQRIRSKFGRSGGLRKTKGISLTLPASYWYLQDFDIKALEEYVDWFNVMTYDMHGAWDINNKWTGPFVNAHTNWTDIQEGLDLLWRNDINPDKVILGTAFYARVFQLANSGCSEPKCGVVSAGNPGECSKTSGILLDPEVQDIIQKRSLSPAFYSTETVKAVHWDNQWASFDDEETWTLKINNARGQCIKGIMVWAISQDDRNSTNAMALTRAAGREVMDMPDFNEQPVTTAPLEPIQLCRWTNCGEKCPPGFKGVPQDGSKGLMMEDNTPCVGLNPSIFCCPSDQDLPKCTWRGRTPSGDCNPGCNNGEVEVGTLITGCNLQHQSACCTDTSTTHAYGMCSWYGVADLCAPAGKHYQCPKDHSNFVVAANAGFGGEQTCTRGAKSYCCTEIPDQFTDCAWKHIAAKANQSLRFRQNNQVFGGNGAEEFKALMQKYMQDPLCPQTTLNPTLENWHEEPVDRKRSLNPSLNAYKLRRDGQCTQDMWSRLIQYSDVLFGHSSQNMSALQTIWDEDFAYHYDTEITYSTLSTFFQNRPAIDRRAVLEWIFYDPIGAGPALRLSKEVESNLCILGTNQKRGLANSNPNDEYDRWIPRMINSYGDGTRDARDGFPSWVTILDGIEAGDLSLHYARWQYQTGRGTGSPSGPFLELAYWIGPNPGIAPTQQEEASRNLAQYRDRRSNRPRGARDDRWIVFHLHIDPNSRVFSNVNGRTRVGIQHVTMYHGQETTWQSGSWRVDGTDSRGINDRGDGFHCEDDRSLTPDYNLRYVGAPLRASLPQDTFYDRITTWANALFNLGYLSTPGISPIIRGARFDNETQDIDPSSNPAILQYGDPSVEFGGQNPYTLSFTVTMHDGNTYSYNFNIPDPDNPPPTP